MSKFSPAVRERAVRMVQERRGEYPSQWAAIEATSRAIGCVPQTLLEWVKHVEAETEIRAGTGVAAGCKTCGAHQTRIQELEREVEDLRRVVGMREGAIFSEENLERPRQPCAVGHEHAVEVSVRKPLSWSDTTVA
jgi:transposase-like protein